MMVVASATNHTGPLRALLGRYLFDSGRGLFVGSVNKRVYDYLEESLSKMALGKSRVLLARQDSQSVAGFVVLEFGGVGDMRTQEIDGLTFSSR